MKLSEEGKAWMVTLELEKAHKFLLQADAMFAQEMWDLAANRYYRLEATRLL